MIKELLTPRTIFTTDRASYTLIERVGTTGCNWMAESQDRAGFNFIKFAPGYASDQVALLYREAMAFELLCDHPGLVHIEDEGQYHGLPLVVFPYYPRPSLADLKRNTEGRKLPEGFVTRAVMSVASTLDYIHTRRIVHRDVKPANILVGEKQCLLIDFGVARVPQFHDLEGRFFGTPAYASPEVLEDDAFVDGRADVYSLGITAFSCLTGMIPLLGEDTEKTWVRHILEDGPDPRNYNARISRGLAEVVVRATKRHPSDRFQTAGDLRNALRDVSTHMA